MSSHRTERNAVHITTLVATLAAATMVGCQGVGGGANPYASYKAPHQGTMSEKARLAQAQIDPAGTTGPMTAEQYIQDAQTVSLPQQFLSEASTSTAETQARRAAAQSAAVRADADERQAMADADAFTRGARSDNEIAHARASRLGEVYDAKLGEMQARAQTAFIAGEIEANRQDDLLNAAVKEWHSKVEMLRARAEAGWVQANAEHERMLTERDAVESRGHAQIDQMRTVAAQTQERADAKVSTLRSTAATIDEQTQARVAELEQQIHTTRESAQAMVGELRQRSTSEWDGGVAEATQLRARATAIEEQDVDETFQLMLSAADADFAEAKAEAERLFGNAVALEEELAAEFTRRTANANSNMQIEKTDFDSAISAIDSFIEGGKSEIATIRVHSDRIRTQARAEFVKAEAAARAEAIRETTRQEIVLAEEEAERLRAEAEAEATRVQADFFSMLAEQRKNGNVTLPGRNEPVEPKATSSDDEPEFVTPADAAARLKPSHVAAFKSALAESVKLREQADAQERDLFATAQERRAGFNAWWDQRRAQHEAAVAEAEHYKTATLAKIGQFRVEAESMLNQATAELERDKMNADAERRESIASMTTLVAEADSVEKKAQARQTQLGVRAEATERNAQSELRSLQVVLESTKQRGHADASRLRAEANSLQQSQRAVVAQMHREIESAQQILSSELAKLDQSAESFIMVAQANYDENLAEVAMLEQVNEATRVEMAAANDAQRQFNLADVAYMKDVNSAQQLIAEASVQRVVANADADFGIRNAEDAVARAGIIARTQMAHASVEEQFTVADAEDFTTRARFDARIASTFSDRDRAYANEYLENMQGQFRTQQAVAVAAAYQELSNQAMAALNEKTEDFNTAAQENWSSQLAMPNPMPQPIDTMQINHQAEQMFQLPPMAGVSTDED